MCQCQQPYFNVDNSNDCICEPECYYHDGISTTHFIFIVGVGPKIYRTTSTVKGIVQHKYMLSLLTNIIVQKSPTTT